MANSILVATGGRIEPPEGVELRDYFDSLMSLATVLRWSLPKAQELQSTEELVEGQRLKEATAWAAAKIDDGQARF